MALKFAYNRSVPVQAKLICRSKLSMIEYVFEQLDDCHKQQFESSCFKNLLKLRSTNVAYQLFHQLLMRQVQTSKTKEIWFEFKGKVSRFGLEEFTLITGLNAGDLEEEVVKGKAVPRLFRKYFANKCSRKINREDLKKAFGKCNDPEDKYKLGLLVCLVSVLLGAEQKTLLNPWLFFIVEDVDKFNNYPWGKKSFLYTIKNFKRKLEIGSNKSSQKMDVRYNLHGFPLAVMIWGLEAIPALGKKFANSIGERVPRMLSWKLDDRLLSTTLNTFLESREHNVLRKMEPTEAEKAEKFWQQITHFDDEEDSRVDNIEDDDESVYGGADNDAAYGGADNDAEDSESDFSSDDDILPETQRLVCAGRQLDGNRTLVENHIGMESTSAGIIKNREGPQSAPVQLNVTSQGQYELCKRPAPQLAPEQSKRARPATETTTNSSSHSIFDKSDEELSNETYQAKIDLLTHYQEEAASALNDLKRGMTTAQSKVKELKAMNSELRHKNNKLSSRCATLEAEDEKIKEKLMVSRTKEKELEATVSTLTHNNKVCSAECSLLESRNIALETEYKKTKEELENCDKKLYSGARAAGYAEGLKKGKLKSAEFLDRLNDASVKFFDYDFDSCQKQAEQQGFVGKLDKNSALNEAYSKHQQSNTIISK